MIKHGLIFVVALFWLSAASAQDELKELQQYFDSVQSLHGSFTQVTREEGGEVLEESTGELFIQRPNRFRWSYQEPYEQEIVADGKRLWVYDVDLEQVTIRPLEEVLGFGPALLLSGDFASLQKTFQIRAQGDGWLELKPREKDWDFQAVRLRLRDGVPQIIEVDSGLGQITRLEMDDLQRNPRIPAERFRFSPPRGVDVIDGSGSPR